MEGKKMALPDPRQFAAKKLISRDKPDPSQFFGTVLDIAKLFMDPAAAAATTAATKKKKKKVAAPRPGDEEPTEEEEEEETGSANLGEVVRRRSPKT
jgi:hypothetical protein